MVLRAGFHGTVGQPSAQVIDGSLKFDKSRSQYLKRTPGSAGNRSYYTGSAWVKRTAFAPENNSNNNQYNYTIFSAGTNSANNIDNIKFYKNAGGDDANKIEYASYTGSYQYLIYTNAKYRDPNGWYHVVWNYNGTRSEIYINGEHVTSFDTNTQNGGSNGHFNNNVSHVIGHSCDQQYNMEFDGFMSQFYWIDGLALGPEYFGFTDPLTNTWRPKKFRAEGTTVNDGTTWSSGIPGNTLSGYPATNAFNGNVSSFVYADVNTTMTWTAPKRITGQKIEVYAYAGGNWPILEVNGQSTGAVVGGTTQHNVWVDVTDLCGGPGGVLETITAYGQNIGGVDRQSGFSAVAVDGVILVDSTTQNLAYGTNGFWLPMDGNSTIGQDKSGNGNDWTPVNFGGSNSIEKATGAFPILDTIQGGTKAGLGVFASKENKIYTVTTANGSVYQFDITSGDNPSLEFIRGATYKFDYSGHTGHPLLFSSSNPDSSVTAYTDGTSISSNVISFTVPHDAPATLYYYCDNHSNDMNGAISVTTDETKADPYAWKCVLANPLCGNVEDVSHLMNCTTTEKTMTIVGSAVESNTNGNFYNASWNFDYSDDQITTPDSTDFTFGSGDFTMECWFYQTGQATWNYLMGQYGATYNTFFALASNKLYCYFYHDSTNFQLYDPSTLAPNQWVHAAVTRSGNVFRLFINGVMVHSVTQNVTLLDAGIDFSIGADSQSNYHFQGQIQDVRVYKGVAKYTSDFILPSTNPDIIPDTPSGVSGSSKLTKITDGSIDLNGNGDYIEVADSTDFTFGSDEFTMECFVYPKNPGSTQYEPLINKYGTNASDSSFWYALAITPAGVASLYFYMYVGGSTYYNSLSSALTRVNAWNHIVVTREGNTVRLYVNGVQDGYFDATGYTMNDTTAPVLIGSDGLGNYLLGNISNVRIVKGTCLYPYGGKTFTPPRAPLTNVTNTKLLCCQKEQLENNFIRMFLSDTLYTSKTDILANATEVGDGESGVTNKYWYIVPTGTEPDDGTSAVFTSNGSVTTPHNSNHFCLLYRSGSSWEKTSGTYNSSEYTLFRYKTQDTVASGVNYSVVPSRDFYVFGVDDGSPAPEFIGGTLPTRAKYYNISGAVKPGAITINGVTRPTNFNPFNTSINTVRGQETGYPTWNLLGVSSQTLSNNNMTTTGASGNVLGSMFTPTSGKFYWEVIAGSDYTMTGIQRENNYDMSYPGNSAGQIAMYLNAGVGSGQLYEGGTITSSWGGGVTGDVIGVALDMDNNKVYFYNNGRGLGSGGITGTPEAVDVPTGGGYTANCRSGSGAYDGPSTINFGQKPFKFTPPDGYQPLNAANVRPETVIARPDQYFNNTEWSGDSTDPRQINLGMSPDLIWVKTTNQTNWHWLSDSLRGTADKRYKLYSNSNNAQDTAPIYGQADSFNDFGFVAGGGTDGSNPLSDSNQTGTNYICWSWKAGGSKGTFNIDGEGYASASDVNMSVDALSNKTQNWSGNATGGQNVDRAFDGTGPRKDHYSHTSGSLTVNFSPALSGRIIVYGGAGGAGARTFTLSDGSSLSSGVVYDTAPYYSTLDFGVKSNITSLTCSNGYTLYGVSLDGKMLVDSGVSTNLPSIAPTGCSVGTKQGFSIIKYTGSGSNGTIPHGLSQAPDFFFGRDLDDTSGSRDWIVYHKTMGNTGRLKFVGNASISESSTFFRDAGPTNSLISVGTSNDINSTNDYILYCFHNVPGLQKFGGYTGNGSEDGPFVETGFRPALIWTRAYSSNSNNNSHWLIYDTLINPHNESSEVLYINLNNQVNSHASMGIDILSNGFKLKADSSGYSNYNGWSYVYCAWAEAPEFNLYGGQSLAR